MTGFANAADMLANNKILNFDADSYITGAAPRYIGAPDGDLQLPFDRPLPFMPQVYHPAMYGFNARLAPQVSADAFVSRHTNNNNATAWFAGILGALGFATLACVGAHKKKKAEEPPKDPGVNTKAVNTADASKSSTAENTAEAAKKNAKSAVEKVKNGASSLWTKVKNFKVPLWGKIAIGVTSGAMILYGAYKALSKPTIDRVSLPQNPRYPY